MKTERGISPFSHNPSEPCGDNILSCVQMPIGIGGGEICISAFSESPVRLPSLIKHIGSVIRNSKIADSVVRPISIQVVNFRGWISSIMQEPRQPVSQIVLAAGLNRDVPISVDSSSGITNSHPGSIDGPSNDSGISAIIKAFFDGFWDNCKIHFKLPLDLARGRAVVAVRFPLYRVSTGVLA